MLFKVDCYLGLKGFSILLTSIKYIHMGRKDSHVGRCRYAFPKALYGPDSPLVCVSPSV